MPLPQMRTPGLAAQDLGLGSMLQDQVAGETEEMRKKRMQEMQQRGFGSSPAAAAPQSLATLDLFGGMSGLGR